MKMQQIVSEILKSNTFVVSEDGEAIIIDAGATLDKVVKAVGENKVVGILLTHGHFDHCFYILDYLKRFNCPVIIHSHGKKTLNSSKLNYGENFSLKTSEDFVFIKRDSEIKLGHFEIKAYTTPGHSPCGLSYLIDKELFAGDTVFYNGIGRLDLIESDDEKMVNSLSKLYKLTFEKLHSGHSKSSSYIEQQRNLRVYLKFLTRKK